MREMGPTGFTVFQLLVGGTVLAALVHLLFIIQLIWTLATGSFEANAGMLAFSMASLAAGYSISMIVGAIGLWRRRLMGCAWVLALMPIYWLMLSLAAWRAVAQLMFDPHGWEKTEHGLAKTSRLVTRETVPLSPR